MFYLAAAAQVLELDAVGVEPLAVRMLGSQFRLDFPIVIDLAFLGVHEEHLARFESSLGGHFGRVEIHNAHLAGHHHHIAFGNGISGRTQAVAVEHSADVASVAEEQGGRSVPRFHKYGMILVEGPEVL